MEYVNVSTNGSGAFKQNRPKYDKRDMLIFELSL